MNPAATLGRLVLLGALVAPFGARDARGFDEGRARFSLGVKGHVIPYRIMSVTALPGESLTIETLTRPGLTRYAMEADCGELRQVDPVHWRYTAPATGSRCKVKVRSLPVEETVELNVFVLVPYALLAGEHLNGYRVGQYPEKPLRGDPLYARPKGFVEVTKDDADTHLTPHFRIEQFLSKQADPFPKYLIFDERLLLKLEALLAELRAAGVSADTLHVMSGYRTPFYNRAIDNVPYSMHLWGGAADIFVDKDQDDLMDDLTGDNRVDLEDARFLYQFVDRLEQEQGRLPWPGGLGLYRATAAHGPFVHVDVRGRRARWGNADPGPLPACRSATSIEGRRAVAGGP